MKYIFTLSLLICQQTFAQVDYATIKERFIRTCGQMDTADVHKNVHFVDSVATLNVFQNKEQFLMDYAWAYYRLYLVSKKNADLLVTINCYSQCWEEFGNTQALFSMGSNYAQFNCTLSRHYLTIFEEVMHQEGREIDDFKRSQIALIREEVCD